MNVLRKINFNSQNPLAVTLCLSLSSLLISYFLSSLFLVLFAVLSLRYAIVNKVKFKLDKTLLIPVLLYLLFITSLIWTVDKGQTIKGLERLVVLLVVPVAFNLISPITRKTYHLVLYYFTSANFFLGAFFLIRASVNYFKTKEISVFLYHDLVNVNAFDLNAIYVSLAFIVGLIFLISKKQKTIFEKAQIAFFCFMLLLLSSKMIIFSLMLSVATYVLINLRGINIKKIVLSLFAIVVIVVIGSKIISERVSFEKRTRISQVLNNDTFGKAYYWTGTSIRLFQLRILKEQLQDENILFKGFGLFASKKDIKKRHSQYDTYYVFHSYNYHNQYAQMLAELGIFGLLLLLTMLVTIIVRGFRNKDFITISFSILMASVFLTESILWRQRGLFLFIIIYCLLLRLNRSDKTDNIVMNS